MENPRLCLKSIRGLAELVVSAQAVCRLNRPALLLAKIFDLHQCRPLGPVRNSLSRHSAYCASRVVLTGVRSDFFWLGKSIPVCWAPTRLIAGTRECRARLPARRVPGEGWHSSSSEFISLKVTIDGCQYFNHDPIALLATPEAEDSVRGTAAD